MLLIRTVLVAFAMYSRVPMPKTAWEGGNLRYVFCAFPLIGALTGLCVWGWIELGTALQLGLLLRTAGIVLIPLMITGGIHMDGFCDTVDALSSRAPRERKLEILKDPHAGAFALIGAVSYTVAYFALCSELPADRHTALFLGAGFMLSRTLSGISVVSFPMAKPDGLASSFSAAAAKLRVRAFLCALLALLLLLMFLADIPTASCITVTSAAAFLYYYAMSRRQFGGVTGDLAGYFLQICELCVPAALIASRLLQE